MMFDILRQDIFNSIIDSIRMNVIKMKGRHIRDVEDVS